LQHGPAIDNAETVWWCDEHDGQGVPRLGRDPYTCWKAEFIRHLVGGECRIVERRLPQIGEGE
jgi:hypothetical protein